MRAVIYEGADQIASLTIGEMGIKNVAVGDEIIYTRPGGYFYLELDTKES